MRYDRVSKTIETGKFETLEVGHAICREDVPQLTATRDKFSKFETTTMDVGSYTGSECLSFGLKIETYHRKSDRAIAKYGTISIPYSEIETMELIRDVIDKAIADAKEWQSEQPVTMNDITVNDLSKGA